MVTVIYGINCQLISIMTNTGNGFSPTLNRMGGSLFQNEMPEEVVASD